MRGTRPPSRKEYRILPNGRRCLKGNGEFTRVAPNQRRECLIGESGRTCPAAILDVFCRLGSTVTTGTLALAALWRITDAIMETADPLLQRMHNRTVPSANDV